MNACQIILPANSEAAPTIPEGALAAFSLWKQLRGERLLPHRSDFRPISWRGLLSDISIVELHEGEGDRYFVRLHGGRTQQLVGLNLHKRYLESGLTPETREIALAPYIESERTLCPTLSTMRPNLYPGVSYALSRLVLPFTDVTLGDEPERVDRFVTWVGASCRPPYDMASVYDGMSSECSATMDAQCSLSVLAG